MDSLVYRKNGITVISKHDPAQRAGRPSRVALVLAGGAIAGGAFKAGGLRALDELLLSRRSPLGEQDFRLTHFDTFVGLSAGSVLASALAAGIEADELFRITTGNSPTYPPMRPLDFMRPNLLEPPERVALFIAKLAEVVGSFLARRENPRTGRPFTTSETLGKMASVITRIVPTGLFDARGVRDYLRRQIARTGLPDDFRELKRLRNKSLYVTAVDINSGSQVVFGPDERYCDVPISEAVAASCGLPGWYRTVRVRNPLAHQPGERRYLDLADGGMVRTANVGVAVKRGADLVIVYNPFTPIRYQPLDRSLYEHGAYALVSQLFRTVLGSRLDIGKEKILFDPTAQADIVYVEPRSEDLDFFEINPLNFWSKRRAAQHGYQSVQSAFSESYEPLQRVFARHGISLAPRPGEARPVLPNETPSLN